MTLKKTTQIVTIDEQFLPELRNWLEDRDGECKAWDLVIGQYGHLYLNSIPHSLVREITVQVAIQAPDKQFPPWMEVAESKRETILQSATDSYSWMYDGYFEPEEITDLMESVNTTLIERTDQRPEDPEALVEYLRSSGLDEMPDWDNLNRTGIAMLSEAAQSKEWLGHKRLYSERLDDIGEQMKAGTIHKLST